MLEPDFEMRSSKSGNLGTLKPPPGNSGRLIYLEGVEKKTKEEQTNKKGNSLF